ncbi:hypothetical protein PFICI_00405 [Pestalotiopsis fici W106-1]|uniref:Nucleoside phosphorylase domain-containing protein n=1 Tax=Pestalotiopsis fici (strain W106-1 / CGMCC3.15140) TaxID=1229662 RepID=W3XM64_PESFW|nr:uncharacterized protein PFICI_00405 [Pestalotiopsis fici W106-1]ETS86577.1 hypothetical protein PFICI_00405 [Pestalotiopsis fici W106-1]
MPRNIITNSGSGAQYVMTGTGDQYNHCELTTQFGPHGTSNQHSTDELAAVPTCNKGRPSRRADFCIAIICALTVEFDAVSLLFDEMWDEEDDAYGRAPGDTNTYTTGRIGKYNVALALLPNMGTASAAGAAAGMRSSFPRLRLVLVVGVCGGVPGTGTGKTELLLGDVVISKTIQQSLGKQYPAQYVLKDTIDDNLGRLNKDIRTLVMSFETELGQRRLQRKAGGYLKVLQREAVRLGFRQDYQYPGLAEDKLFAPTYRHKHHLRNTCTDCSEDSAAVCDIAVHMSCVNLCCDESQLVPRIRLKMKAGLEPDVMQCPEIHIGRIRSGDTVIKSGEHRDRVAEEHNVIAFEMEGAGVWDEVPSIVVKGVCDYADSHKNKEWQPFAAATAASVAKAVLERYTSTIID